MALSLNAETSHGDSTATIGRITVIAQKEFTHTVRSHTIRGLFLIVTVATMIAFRTASGHSPSQTADAAVGLLGLPLQLVIPVAAILTGCFAISGERDSGSLRLLLGLPSSRIEVVLGKFLGIVTALTAGIGVTLVVGSLVSVVTFGTIPIRGLVGLGVATTLLAGAFLGLSLGASAITRTRKQATAIAIGSYLTLLFLWELLVAGAYYVLTQSPPQAPFPMWVSALDAFNPITAYANAAAALGADAVAPLRVSFGLLALDPATTAAPENSATPLYLTDAFGTVILAIWILLPLAIGTLRFRHLDL